MLLHERDALRDTCGTSIASKANGVTKSEWDGEASTSQVIGDCVDEDGECGAAIEANPARRKNEISESFDVGSEYAGPDEMSLPSIRWTSYTVRRDVEREESNVTASYGERSQKAGNDAA